MVVEALGWFSHDGVGGLAALRKKSLEAAGPLRLSLPHISLCWPHISLCWPLSKHRVLRPLQSKPGIEGPNKFNTFNKFNKYLCAASPYLT